MNVPFVYGRIAEDKDFTGREADISRLKQNLTNRINTVIISPRRWGKSSLVHKTLGCISAEDKNFITCHVDAFNCRNEEDFFRTYINSVLHATTTKVDEVIELVKKYIGSFGPKISLGDAGSMMEYSLGIDFYDKQYSVDEILDFPEKIAKERGKQMIVCIDEFQNIENFTDSKAFQARLRSHWQLHQNVCYCLYGSKRHMLLNILSNYEMPLYKFGDVMIIEKIASNVWADFIVRRFNDTGKNISQQLAEDIANKVECHSYYVQQYSQLVWLLTSKTAGAEELEQAYNQMIDRSSLLFYNLVDNLNTKQVNFLLAIANGETNFSSACVLKKYSLGTSANIKNLKKAVTDKDLVNTNLTTNTLTLQDPLFKHWLLNRFKV